MLDVTKPGWLLATLGLAMGLVMVVSTPTPAAELVTLSPDNYESHAPQGEMGQSFFGDYVLRNDHVTAAVADPKLMMGRSANRWRIDNVAGTLVGLTVNGEPNNLLTAYYPSLPPRFKPDAPNWQHEFTEPAEAYKLPGRGPKQGKQVTLELEGYEAGSRKSIVELQALPAHLRKAIQPYIDVAYSIGDGDRSLTVTTAFNNTMPKAWQPNLTTELRADRATQYSVDLDGHLFLAADQWRDQAVGVLATDHTLKLNRTYKGRFWLTHITADGKPVTLTKGEKHKVVRHLIPGRNGFEVRAIAADLLGLAQHAAKFIVADSQGPVANATVFCMAADKPGQLLASGHTSADGQLDVRLTPGDYRLRIEAPGRPTVTHALSLTSDAAERITMQPAGYVAFTVRDGEGNAIPCKVQFDGRGKTATPSFYPETGDHQVANLYYSHNGKFTQPLLPGDYRLTVSHGPEHTIATRDITVKAGQTVAFDAALEHVVHTPDHLAMDTHNHSALTGATELFYIYPYERCPVVDGESQASTLGRVLNLVCEGIEFAPTSEHNFVADYLPLLEQLGVADRIATPTGVGLSAGRRHTVNHQNVFPIPHIHGAQDGGITQRPEHIHQIDWVRKIYDESEKVIIVSQPWSKPIGEMRNVDALDVHDLTPIVDGQPHADGEDRILDWIATLQKGYRVPGVVGSNAYSNHHGSGHVRSYVHLPAEARADKLAELDPLQVARAIKAGHVTMTTGPFLEVSLTNPSGKAAEPGDEIRSPDGHAKLHIRVQTPPRITIDRVQVLLNGNRSDALNLTAQSHAVAFKRNGVVAFDHTLDLALAKDSFIIVVASGSGPNLYRRSDKDPAVRTEVAVSNPIYVDMDPAGFSPHSPLNDQVAAQVDWVRPLLLKKDAPPGLVRLHLRHNGPDAAEDTATLVVYPESDMELLSPATQSYTLEPGRETSLQWEVRLSDSYLKSQDVARNTYNSAGKFGVKVARSAKFPGRKPTSTWARLDNPITALPPIASLDQVQQVLADRPAYPLKHRRNGTERGTLRYAIVGDAMALDIDIIDPAPRRREKLLDSSCFELFGSRPTRDYEGDLAYGGYHPVRQAYLLPGLDGGKAEAFHRDGTEVIKPNDEIQLRSKLTDRGYQMQALVPMHLLGVDLDSLPKRMDVFGIQTPIVLLGVAPVGGRFVMEGRVTTFDKAGRATQGQLFAAGSPHNDHHDYGFLRILGPVKAELEVVDPITPGGQPAHLKLHLTNTADEPMADQVTIAVEEGVGASIVGSPTIAYQLKPGESKDFDIQLALAGDSLASGVTVTVERSPKNHVMPTFGGRVAVRARPLPQLGAIRNVKAVHESLADLPAYPVAHEAGPLAQVRFARAGDQLAVLAQVRDAKIQPNDVPWRGSCLELFGAMGPQGPIGQVFLSPAKGDIPARAYVPAGKRQALTDKIAVDSVATEQGYTLAALIPLDLLKLDPAASDGTLEFQVTGHDAAGEVQRGTMFKSVRAYLDAKTYGRFSTDSEVAAPTR